MIIPNIAHAATEGKRVSGSGKKRDKGARRQGRSRRPACCQQRRAAITARRKARKRLSRVGSRASLLRRFVEPLRLAVAQSLEEETERRWFPALSMLAMILCGLLYHLFGLSSMRATVEKANCVRALGIGRVSRSTFSDAMNSPLRLRLLRDVFQNLLLSFSNELPPQLAKFRHLAAIDSTILHCAPAQLWAQYRKEVNACKAHLSFDLSRGIPEQLALSAARIHDRKYFELFLKKGWTYIVDRAYNDYSLFDAMIALDIFFVTRLKSDASYRVIERKRVKRKHRKLGVISDEIIRLGAGATEMANNLRLVVFRTEEGKVMHFLTSRMDLAPTSIAALYHARWAIELFFRFLKRTLRGVRLLARSEVGAEIHVLLALLTDVLLKCVAKALKCWQNVRRHVPARFLRLIRELLLCHWTKQMQARLVAALL